MRQEAPYFKLQIIETLPVEVQKILKFPLFSSIRSRAMPGNFDFYIDLRPNWVGTMPILQEYIMAQYVLCHCQNKHWKFLF